MISYIYIIITIMVVIIIIIIIIHEYAIYCTHPDNAANAVMITDRYVYSVC